MIYFDKKCEAKYNSPLSIIGFADFETKLCKINPIISSSSFCQKCRKKNCSHISYTKQYESHELISYSLIFMDSKSTLVFEKHYCGPMVEENFFQTLLSLEESILLKICSYKDIRSMKPLTQDEKMQFERATYCYICKAPFDSQNRLKMKNMDHNHYTSLYQGAACTWCNLLNRSQREIPIP